MRVWPSHFDTARSLPLAAANGWVVQLALGRALRGAGHAAEGSQVLQQLVEGLRDAAPGDAAQLDSLAIVLNTAAAELWDSTLAALHPHPALQRRLALQRRRPAGEIGLTVQLLLDTIAEHQATELRTIRQAARTARSIDRQGFDQAWLERAGAVPDWLFVDEATEWAAIGWWNTPTWKLSRDYLRAHPQLLDARTDIVLEEFAAAFDRRERVDQYLRLLAAARRDGVDAAYAPLLLDIEVAMWLHGTDPQEHLGRHPELLRSEVLDRLRAAAAEGDAVAATFAAIHELARRGEQDLAFQAGDKPATMTSRLRVAWRAKDAARLEALATIVMHVAQDEAVGLHAAVAVQVAQVLQQRAPEVPAALRDRLRHADADLRATLTDVITDAMAHHPGAAASLATLLQHIG
jgi:hypothetical protein